MARSFGYALALVAFGLGGCEQPPAAVTGEVDVELSLHELRAIDWAVWGAVEPISYELRFSVEDAAGREVDHEVVLTTLWAWETQLSLGCVAGEQNTLKARLVGAYAGRPRAPRGGEGGLAPGQPYETRTSFDCVEAPSGAVKLPDVTAPDLPEPVEDPDFDVEVSFDAPARLAGHAVVIGWETTFDWGGDAPYVDPWLRRWSLPETGRDTLSHACWADSGAPMWVRYRALFVEVDGALLPRDAWRLDDLEVEADCPLDGEGVTRFVDLTLELSDAWEVDR